MSTKRTYRDFEKNKSTLNGDLVPFQKKTSTDEITDEIWFEIMLLCYGNKLGSVSLDLMFMQLSVLSKYFYNVCCRYVQKIPQDIFIFSRNEDLPMLSWACKKQIKIKSILVMDHGIDSLTMRIIIFLLTSANIVELNTLDLMRVTRIDTRFNDVKKLKGFFPDYILRPTAKQCDHHYFHSSIANVLSVDKLPMRKLKIDIDMDVWPHCILDVVSETLEELHLKISSKECETRKKPTNEEFVRYLTRTIEAMRKLKKLVLNIQAPADAILRSCTLEEIDMTLCHSSAKVVECNCPSLQMITVLHRRGESAIRPFAPFKDDEIEGRIEGIFEGDDVASFTHKDRSFMGFAVPPSCKIRLVLDRE